MSTFLENLGTDVRPVSKRLRGAIYMPWALSLEMAGFPQLETVMFEDNGCMSLVRDIFGGAVVAIDQKRSQGKTQRVYLPVLDNYANPISAEAADGRDVTDTINRCRARAVAMIHGVGLSLWSEFEGDGPGYVEAFKVQADTDLKAVAEIQDIKEFKDRNGHVKRTQRYLGWHAALAAAMVTDKDFHWEIVETNTVDENGVVTKQPYAKVKGKGWLVGVRVTWKGVDSVEWLPIMGVETVQTNNGPKPMEHQSIATVNAFQWHSACMRCLAKAIALRTGYGIRSYAGELGVRQNPDDQDSAPAKAASAPARQSGQNRQQATGQATGSQSNARSASSRPSQRQQQQPAQQPADVGSPQDQTAATEAETQAAHKKLLKEVRELMGFVNDKTAFYAWMNIRSLEEASCSDLASARQVLQARKERMSPIQNHLPVAEKQVSVH